MDTYLSLMMDFIDHIRYIIMSVYHTDLVIRYVDLLHRLSYKVRGLLQWSRLKTDILIF